MENELQTRRQTLGQLTALGVGGLMTYLRTPLIREAESASLPGLEDVFEGNFVSRGEADYESWRQAMVWHVSKPSRYPESILQPRSEKDVISAVRYASKAQKKIALANKTIPAPTGAVQDAEIQALATLSGFGASLNLGVPMANTPYASAQWGPVGNATTAVWNGAQAPAEAMADAQAAAEEAIDEMK